MASLIDRYEAFIIDLDGVLYLLEDPVPGAAEAVCALRDRKKSYVFLTNNSSTSPRKYVEKLGRFGIKISDAQVVTSSQALASQVAALGFARGSTAFVIGEAGLIDQIREMGFRLLNVEEGGEADYIFVGWGRNFNFDKLKAAVKAVRRGAVFMATNRDATYPTPNGLWPGAGTLVAAVSTGSGVEPYVAGKPNPLMVKLALQRMEAAPARSLLIGDRLDTDIMAGVAAGVDTLLVLSGVSSVEDIQRSDVKPKYVMNSIAGLLEG